jgi:hypothetical protein
MGKPHSLSVLEKYRPLHEEVERAPYFFAFALTLDFIDLGLFKY